MRRVTLRCVGVVPHGTVTFLFTDVEGSTRLWEEDGEAMRLALAAHDRILRSVIEAHDGYVFSTAGDAFSAAFSTPAAGGGGGGRGAAAARGGVVGRWRCGCGWGCTPGRRRSGTGDYFGPAVNRAARVMSAGHGGQVLLSLVTEELVRDRLPDDVSLVELGEHDLVGLSRPERLFQVAAPGLGVVVPAAADGSVPGREPRRVGDELRGPRRGVGATGGGVAGAADGHVDRGRRGGQDPPGDGGGPGGGGRVPRRGVVVRAGPRRGSRRGGPCGGDHPGGAPPGGPVDAGQRGGRPAGPAPAADPGQLRARAGRGGRAGPAGHGVVSDGGVAGHQPRAGGRGGRTGVGGAVPGRRGGGCGAVLRSSRRGRRRLLADGGGPGGHRRDLRAARRDPPGHRAGRRPGPFHDPQRAGRPAR